MIERSARGALSRGLEPSNSRSQALIGGHPRDEPVVELLGWIIARKLELGLEGGDLDLCFSAIGASASLELVPHVVRGGAIAIDKSSAWRMKPDVPLVVPEVNGDRALEHNGVIAVPNCSTIQMMVALKPLHDAAGLRSVRVATY